LVFRFLAKYRFDQIRHLALDPASQDILQQVGLRMRQRIAYPKVDVPRIGRISRLEVSQDKTR
jgi:hypothetical protein